MFDSAALSTATQTSSSSRKWLTALYERDVIFFFCWDINFLAVLLLSFWVAWAKLSFAARDINPRGGAFLLDFSFLWCFAYKKVHMPSLFSAHSTGNYNFTRLEWNFLPSFATTKRGERSRVIKINFQ
jgi:hypothetical protein